MQHLGECLQLHTESAHETLRPAEVGIALWFHDAIYDVRANYNEARSADWAMATLQSLSAEEPTRGHALIMATEHTAAHLTGNAALLVDIDLAILGATPRALRSKSGRHGRSMRGCQRRRLLKNAARCCKGLLTVYRFTQPFFQRVV